MNWFKRALYAVFFARYDATQYSTFRSWRPATLQDSRLDLTKATREVLQAKSRDFERNSPLYSKIADVREQYSVGQGIQFTSASSDPAWNVAADVAWERWKPVADLQSRFGFDNLQGVIARSLFVDGEVFVLLTRESRFPRIQLIEAHRCKTPPQLEGEEGKTIVDGVKLDALKRPVGYYFQNGESYVLESAENVVHIFEPSRPGQYRGIPYCTAAINVLHDLEDLRTLEMRASKDAAEMSTIIKTQNGELPPALTSLSQAFTSKSSANGTAGSVSETKREFYQTTVGGRTIVLQSGDDASQFRPERPGQNTREYWRLLAGDVCACASVPLSIIYPDSMQGTVYRGSLDSFAAFCRSQTAMLASYFRRIRNYVIQIEASYNSALSRLPEDWRRVSNGTVRAPNVDIGRNSRAILDEVAGGLRTFTSVASELGLDGKELLRQKADEAKYIRELAIERGIDPSEVSSIVVNQPNRAAVADAVTPKPEDSDDVSAIDRAMDIFNGIVAKIPSASDLKQEPAAMPDIALNITIPQPTAGETKAHKITFSRDEKGVITGATKEVTA